MTVRFIEPTCPATSPVVEPIRQVTTLSPSVHPSRLAFCWSSAACGTSDARAAILLPDGQFGAILGRKDGMGMNASARSVLIVTAMLTMFTVPARADLAFETA